MEAELAEAGENEHKLSENKKREDNTTRICLILQSKTLRQSKDFFPIGLKSPELKRIDWDFDSNTVRMPTKEGSLCLSYNKKRGGKASFERFAYGQWT